MIEENVINWIDLGEAKQPLDIYGEKIKMLFFKLMLTIKSENKSFGALDYLFQIIFFFQIASLTLYGFSAQSNDYVIILFKYLSKVFLLYELADSSTTYITLVVIIFFITLVFISILTYLIICIKREIKPKILLLKTLNILVIFEIYYLIGPIINICLTAIVCKNGNHIYINDKCFGSISHILIFVACTISLLFHLIFSITLSIYYSDIANVGEYGTMTRVSCLYEIYSNLAVIILFIFHFALNFYLDARKLFFILWELFVFVLCIYFSVYVYKFVFFYNSIKNNIIYLGSFILTWFSLIVLLKQVLDIYDVTIFLIIGIVIIIVSIFAYMRIKLSYMISDFNIFDGKVLKDIEIYKFALESLINNISFESRTLLHGYIHRFEEFLLSNPDLSGKYQKLKEDAYLNNKISQKTTISVFAIIYLTYSYHIEKSIEHSAEIAINMCYFLINRLKNPTYAIFLCSEIKVKTHRQLYYKFILMEQIKEHLINKITYSSNKESIKHVEIGSVILYNIYCTLFKLKIYDATSNQIEYFDNFKSTVTTKKSTENFLKSGEGILRLKTKILCIWSQLLQLNPFNLSMENDYMLYLKVILQDDILARTEEKKNFSFKNKLLRFRNNTYFSMFNEEQSSFLLIDGANDANLKILYTTPNFSKLFLFSGKEMLNTSVNDLLPNVIQKHHKEFVDDAIKYSNLNHVFKKSKDVLVKTKNNGLININLYVKCVPNLSFGLNYMAYLNKNKDKNFIIIVDKDLKINGFTEDLGSVYNNDPENFIINGNNYGLTQSVIGHHIGMVIPDILLVLNYDETKNNFYIKKIDTELKGNLYPINPWKEIEHRVDYFLDKLKSKSKSLNLNKNGDENELNNVLSNDYESIVGDIKKKFPNPVSVFYKVNLQSFLRNTFIYYRIYITSDLIKVNQMVSKDNTLLSNVEDDDEHFSKLNWKATTLTIDRKEVKKKKEIKMVADSLIKKKNNAKNNNNDNDLIEDEGKKENEDLSNKDVNNENKKIENENIKSFNNIQMGSGKESKKNNEIFQIASADEAKYNRLKKNIVDNKGTYIIFYMKLLNAVFALLSIFFIVYDSIINKNNIANLNKYLMENLIFNHSKISSGILYLNSIFFKFTRENYLSETSCLTGLCHLVYIDRIIYSVDDLRQQKDKFSSLSEDFAQKVKIKEFLKVANKNGSELIEVNMEFMMNLLINYGLRIREVTKIINDNVTIFENNKEENVLKLNMSLNNLIEQSDKLEVLNINGYKGQEKKQRISQLFNPFPVSLLIMVTFIVLFIGVFFYFIYYLYSYEVFFIEKLIDFNNPKYEQYLKQLEELKKRLRNENEDEDEEDKEDDLGFGTTGINSKKDEDSKKKGKDKDKNEEEKKDKEDLKKKRMRGKEKSKFQHQQKKKKTIMRKFFVRINLLFCIRIFVLGFLGLTYYIFSTVIKSNTQHQFLETEQIADETEGIYKEALDIHLDLIRTVQKLVEFINSREDLINNGNITVNGKIYFSSDIEIFENETFPTLDVKNIDKIDFPKLGNLLMPIVSSSDDDSSSIHSQFNELYNGNACDFLFPESGIENKACTEFWNGIIAKGMEQSLTQMSVALSSVLDEIKIINNKNIMRKNITNLCVADSYFFKFQSFVDFFLYRAYLKTSEMFGVLRENIVKDIKDNYDILLYLYLVVSAFLFFMILLFIFSLRRYFNSFFNFVAIFPLKFIMEDENLFRHTLHLQDSLYRN